MIAMVIDANNKIYPLALAVVENESTETWGLVLGLYKKVCYHSEQAVCHI